jgi:nucleotide-binding universal stress UspA family protein
MTDAATANSAEHVGPGRVVVGVDGSDPSLRALRWAARQAAVTGSNLEVVTAWTFPEHAAPLGVVPKVPWPDELLAQAQETLDRLLDEVLPDRDKDRVHATVRRGSAAPVLLEAARDADLLVVGSRGRGEFTELVLGSVSDSCARHAGCPVVVVH